MKVISKRAAQGKENLVQTGVYMVRRILRVLEIMIGILS